MGVNSSTGPRVPDIDVLINGSPVPASVLRYVEEVIVDDAVDLPAMFSFTLTSADTIGQENPWVDNTALFSVGNAVEIKMGDAGNLASMIKGEITALEPEFVVSRLPVLRVRGYDRRHRLQRGRKTRSFLQVKDSDIASQIGAAAGLTVDATDTNTSLDYVLQANQTDWEFLCQRAAWIGYEVAVQDQTLLFRPIANSQSAVLTLDMQNDLLEFYPRLSSSGQVSKVTIQGWSVKDKQALHADSQAGDEVSKMGGQSSGATLAASAFGSSTEVVTERPFAVQAEADQIAKARFNEIVLELISGEGVCRGRTDIRAGIVITIDGIGKRFGGQYYVTSAIHRCTPDRGYVTEFKVRRNAA